MQNLDQSLVSLIPNPVFLVEFSGEHTCTCTGVTGSTDDAPRTGNESIYLSRS